MRRALLAVMALIGVLPAAIHAQEHLHEARDSSGIAIVEVLADTLPLLADIAPEPLLVLGSVTDSSSAFTRVSSAVRLSNGVIAVADPPDASIRFFDPGGTLIAIAGGRGEGPGEFRSLAWIKRAGETTVIAYDRSRQLSVFDDRGRLVRSAAVPGPPTGVLSSGELIVSQRLSGATEPVVAGLTRDSSVYLRSNDSAWTSFDTLARFPNSDPPYSVRTTTPAGGLVTMSYGDVMPFGRIASVVISGPQIVFGDGTRWELRHHDREGRLIRIVRRSHAPESVTPALLREFTQAFLATVPEESRASAREGLSGFSPPLSVPAFGPVLTDRIGRIWIQEHAFPGPRDRRWVVLDDRGQPLGTVVVPAGIKVLDPGPDFIVGLRKGPFEIDQVVLLDLVPSDMGPS